MRIRCINNLRNEGVIGSLTKDNEYLVVAIFVSIRSNSLKYNLVDDYNRLAFYESNLFEVIDHKIDSDWIFEQNHEDTFMFLPEGLAYVSFYEDYHNDDPIAIEKFKSRYPSVGS
jgi:hypothetical protein